MGREFGSIRLAPTIIYFYRLPVPLPWLPQTFIFIRLGKRDRETGLSARLPFFFASRGLCLSARSVVAHQ